jgi:GTP-binding protein YchF
VREVDAILYVLRCFEDGDVTHVEGGVDPLRDAAIVETELMLADLESVVRRIQNTEKKAKSGDKASQLLLGFLEAARVCLDQGKPVRMLPANPEWATLRAQAQLLTDKPVVYVCNVGEAEAATGNAASEAVARQAAAEGASCVCIAAQIEAEIALLADPEEKRVFLEGIGLADTGLDRVVTAAYRTLDLLTFFTVGPKEARAWTVRRYAKAPEAAGVIHTDFEKGFIRAETIAYHDYVACNGEQGAREAGKLRLEGKEYVVQDGDVLHFRFAP